MKITAKMLTNEALVCIVDAAIKNRLLPEDVLVKMYKDGLVKQVLSIQRQLKNIEKKAKNKKISRKDAVALYRKEQQLCALGNKKLAILKELDNAADQS